MRPEILNPLFAQSDSLSGVGAALDKPLSRLGLERVKDFLYHLPSGAVKRKKISILDDAVAGDEVILPVTVTGYRSSSNRRAPFRVLTQDKIGNPLAVVYFGASSGWARKQWPEGESRIVSGKLDIFQDNFQIVHPSHVLKPDQADEVALYEPIYPMADGLGQKRLSGFIGQAIGLAPQLGEWADAFTIGENALAKLARGIAYCPSSLAE